jgi:hypothetical protein
MRSDLELDIKGKALKLWEKKCLDKGIKGGLIALLVSPFGFAPPSQATQYFGRMMTGGYLSQERCSSLLDGSNANDFSTISSRIYFKAYEMGERNFEVTADIRDKHDFFDKFDSERLALASGNTFQVQQLSAKVINPRSPWFGALGRFSESDAGGVPVDGIEVGYRWPYSIRTGFFAGLNPKRNDQSYFTYNPDSDVMGLYFAYQPKNLGWNRNAYLTQALIAEQVSGHLDRFYYYNNFVYQWLAPSQVVGMLGLDFVPRVNVQNALVSVNQEVREKKGVVSGTLSAIDSVEYSRRQGLLTVLSPSTYRSVNASYEHRFPSQWSLNSSCTYGARGADGLAYADFNAGPSTNQLFNSKVAGKGVLGVRHNFTTNDAYLKFGFGYFWKLWELGLDFERGVSIMNYGVTFHPMMIEASLARYFSNALYGTFSLEEASNERVTVWSSYFKVGYRFGSEDVAPLRDGAAPRSRL